VQAHGYRSSVLLLLCLSLDHPDSLFQRDQCTIEVHRSNEYFTRFAGAKQCSWRAVPAQADEGRIMFSS